MKTTAVLITLSLLSCSAFAQEEFNLPLPGGDWGLKQLMDKFPSDDTKPALSYIPTVVVPATVAVPATVTAPVTPAPSPLKCMMPEINPKVKDTPVDVVVDQEKQLMYVTFPKKGGGKQYFASRISTGGGLKTPKGINARGPKCASTPEIKTKIIPRILETDFDSTRCTAEDIRTKATVFPVYHSKTYTSEDGSEAPMPLAIRLDNEGNFLHKVPSAYANLLGENVSGGCVRMNPNVSKILFDQMMKYGAIRVTVKPAPPREKCKPQYCDDAMVAKKKAEIANAKASGGKYEATGSEGVAGGVSGFFDRWTCTDTKNSQGIASPESVFPRQAEGRK